MIYTSISTNIATVSKRFSGSYSFVIETFCFDDEIMRWIAEKLGLEIRDRGVGFFFTGCIRACLIES